MQEIVMPANNPEMGLLCLLVPLLPFIGFLINGLGNRKIAKGLVGIIGCGTVLASFLISVYLFFDFTSNGSRSYIVDYYNWVSVGNLQISFSFLIDQLTLLMMLMVTGIGFFIHLYSSGYMSHDENFGKFFSFLNLFMFSMLLLVLGSNYVMMFVGWEGVGLCSYLLIGFWNKNTNYNNAAKKAFIMNRIGDLGFLLGIFLIFITFGSVSYPEVFASAARMTGMQDSTVLIAITMLLFVGAMGKSAQIPLFTWLPDAMAGPTPVSALIHAATMVTAGIYMVIRSNVLYVLAPTTLEVIAIIGLITALLAATIGLAQNDIKKVLAYSTVSQLGFMFLALGVMAFSSSIFHVLTHAFFKALLFLGAGSVIHAMSNEQDIRRMGGLRKALPITFLTFLIGTLAISGIPPFAGFFSKDELLAHVWHHSKIMWGFGVLASFMTAFYMFRLLFLTFFGNFRGTEEQRHHLHESPAVMTIPLIALAVLSTIGGFIGMPEVFGADHILANYFEPIYDYARAASSTALAPLQVDHATEYMLMGVSVAVAVVAIIIAYAMYVKKNTLPAEEGTPLSPAHNLVYHKYYIDEIYNAIFVRPLMWLSGILHRVVDTVLVDGIVNGVGKVVMVSSRTLRFAQSGATGFYLLVMVFSIALILFLNYFI
ncbi:NADH-quinone oxidoreductase subunit L [Pontibacter sp. SGAir0037]|uniref:NADH-quinone oxidoreductase subunit L n=1 Tax=Pontibacter sp. SGAir0037 TaxID=2571030 RepID=UPI0010CCCFEB|nr:NADH-quinone oxidoreductase subunit L [Pontibacter sp. SGAir0037]QCR23624.1 NADH-quinone oxidoreductase subunit L [Pontibacter sp. SGAir0037]